MSGHPLYLPLDQGPPQLDERFFNEIKQRRRVATRYAKLAAIHLAFIKLASNPHLAVY